MKTKINKKTGSGRQKSALRKLQPSCKLPTGAVLRSLSAVEAQRLRMRLVEQLECVFDKGFTKANAEQVYAPRLNEQAAPRLLSSHATRKSESRSLTREEEITLFQRFNYCRWRMMELLKEYADRRMPAAATRELLKWDQAVLDARDEIVEANLGLVPSMVERSRLTGVDFTELISEGQLALMRSADKFDCSRGFKFSTYACRAILTSISRAVALMARHRAHYPTEYDPELQRGDMIESRRAEIEGTCMQDLQAILAENSAELTVTEQKVLCERFGMKGFRRRSDRDTKTLRQVAEVFGVTKERVRQIQNKALAKLRTVLDQRAFAI